jgi:integrase
LSRPATGQVIVRATKRGRVFALRFMAYGQRRYITLGAVEDGWTRAKAQQELVNVLADVRRGIWQPPELEPEPKQVPTFHRFASDWMAGKTSELRPKTVENYTWALSHHLLPYFADFPLSAITAEHVDRYKAAKLGEGKLGANQVNTTLTRLAQILEDAMEYGYIQRNPARGRRRRVKASKPQRSVVEPEQLLSLIEAANQRHRPIIATLAGGGLRVGEGCALDWRDVNLATGTLTVREAKTEAGAGRSIDLPSGLVQELSEHKARCADSSPSSPVFAARCRNGRTSRQTTSNVGRRLKTAIRHANERLAELDIEPISERVTPHSLRRTYASLRAALRDDPVYIAEQLGHTDPTFTLRVYAKATKRRERLTGNYREEFDRARDWALIGTSEQLELDRVREPLPARTRNLAP